MSSDSWQSDRVGSDEAEYSTGSVARDCRAHRGRILIVRDSMDQP